ncbi:MAG: hypothetical protein PVF68_11790 [Acidobacteriota bacterium]|jgi:hypothetical protein
MRFSRILLGLLVVALVCTAPAFAEGKAIGIPDAPPVERVVAREGMAIPEGFEAAGGRRLPGGEYDLALIECGGRYYLEMTHRVSRVGIRIPVQWDTPTLAEGSPRFGRESQTIRVRVGDLVATFPLEAPRTTG